MKVTFTNGQPSTPVAVATGLRLPDERDRVRAGQAKCPYPTGKLVAPLSGPSENPAPDAGPTSDAPATAGFG